MKIFIMLLFSLLVLCSLGYGQNFYLGVGFDASDGSADGCIDCHGDDVIPS